MKRPAGPLVAGLDYARAVADAVLYEGYLLYPYRASSGKNQSRWQFGVLGPPGAAEAGVGEEPHMVSEFLVRHSPSGPPGPPGPSGPGTTLTVRLRFLQLQAREVERANGTDGFVPAAELRLGGQRWLSWDEAVEHEVQVASVMVTGAGSESEHSIHVDGGEDVTALEGVGGEVGGRLVQRRWPLTGVVKLTIVPVVGAAGVSRMRVSAQNITALREPGDKVAAVRRSFLGTHLLITCDHGSFVSMTDPPADLRVAAQDCHQARCWPVLAGPLGSDSSESADEILLASPIILEDHPALAKESPGSLFDSTEIDEILTLRILTMTEDEKAEARATDPRAAQIVDRSEQLSDEEMSRLHGLMRDPRGEGGEDLPWWDPAQDASVDPATDTVMIDGTAVGRGSLVVVHPSRRADAQDLFFDGQTARVTGVHFDVDGSTHVALVLRDDPAADLHDWYGRYLYFDPEELEPLGSTATGSDPRKETRT